MSTSAITADSPNPPQRTFLGHPTGLYVLFFSEMWERFSYYGMRALLVLYLIETFKWSQREASTAYKWYTSLVYLTPLLGGYLADRFLGNKRAVIIGSLLMATGQFLLTFGIENIFIVGLVFMIFGNGFFKPNMSTQVGRLYPQNDPRRDGAYTIFYMGINLGACLAPLVCGWLAANTIGGRHTGFMAAGFGMILGLIVYLVGLRWVIELKPETEATTATDSSTRVVTATDSSSVIGKAISEEKAQQTPSTVPLLNRISPTFLYAVGLLLLFATAAVGGVRGLIVFLQSRSSEVPTYLQTLSLTSYIANNTLISWAIIAGCALFAAWILTKPQNALRDRVLTIYLLGIFVVFFWAAFEQAGNALNIWADKATNRYVTTAAPPPPIYPEKPESAKQQKNQEGQETSESQDTGMRRWVNMWKLKPSKAEDTGKKGGLWAWFKSLWNPVPTEWFQSINALAIFVLAPIFAWMWTALDRRGMNPSVPAKMAIGLVLMSLSFGVMILAGQREDKPTSVTFSGPLPEQIKLNPSKQLCMEEEGELKPFQAGRLTYDEAGNKLNMTGVLSDTERDRMIRETAPKSYVEAVKELQKKTKNQESDRFTVSVTLDPVPPDFDLRYAGLPESQVRYDEKTHQLTATNLKIEDKEVKSLLVAGGEPTFRTALNALYQESAQFRVSPMWLVWYYIISTMAELCLSPVGLSMVSKLAPAKFATMLMGLWLLTNFFGNFAAGAFGERWGEWTPTEYFLYIMAVVGVAALVLCLLVAKIRAMMHGVR